MPTTPSRPAPTDNGACLNCEHPLSGPFCSQCGQRAISLELSVGQLWRTFAGEVLSFDARLWRTLKPLLLRPGFVAAEYFAGRRASYVPPLRMFLFASFLMFLTMAFSPEGNIRFTSSSADTVSVDGAVVGDPSDFGTAVVERMQDPRRLQNDVLRWLNQVVFVLVPVFALLLKMTHWKQPYVRHLVYALYLHVVAFLVFTITELPGALRIEAVSPFVAPLALLVPVYFVIGLRRMYDESWPRTLGKAGVITVAYIVCLLAAMFGAFVLAILF